MKITIETEPESIVNGIEDFYRPDFFDALWDSLDANAQYSFIKSHLDLMSDNDLKEELNKYDK